MNDISIKINLEVKCRGELFDWGWVNFIEDSGKPSYLSCFCLSISLSLSLSDLSGIGLLA